MKVLKWVGVGLAAHVGLVFAFEVLYLGWYQPELESLPIPMLLIPTTDQAGESHTRRVARLETDGGESESVAVPVQGEEFERVAEEFPIPFAVRVMMGFPPQQEILRLDPATSRAPGQGSRPPFPPRTTSSRLSKPRTGADAVATGSACIPLSGNGLRGAVAERSKAATGRIPIPSSVFRARGSRHPMMRRWTPGWSSMRLRRAFS